MACRNYCDARLRTSQFESPNQSEIHSMTIERLHGWLEILINGPEIIDRVGVKQGHARAHASHRVGFGVTRLCRIVVTALGNACAGIVR